MSDADYGRRGSAPLKRRGDRMVDPLFLAVMDRHIPERHHEDVLEYCEGGFGWDQMRILIRIAGGDDAFHADDMAGEWWNMEKALVVTADLAGDMRWRSGELIVPAPTLSETIRLGLVGQPIGTITDHPYVPTELRVGGIKRMGARWHVIVALPHERIPT